MGWAGWDHIFTHGCFICIIWYTLIHSNWICHSWIQALLYQRNPTQLGIQTRDCTLHKRRISHKYDLQRYIYILYSRVEWLWRQKCYTFYVVPNCWRTPIPKVHVLMLPFHLSQGLRKCWLKKKNQGPCDFLKLKTLPRALDRNCRLFGIELLNIYLIESLA